MTVTAEDAGILATFLEAPRPVKALLAGVLVNKLGAFMQVFLVLFLTTRGFSAVQAGDALGAYGAGSVAGVLAGGVLTDRIGARWAIVFGMAGTAVLLLGVLYLHAYLALVSAVMLVGALSQIYRPASATLLAEFTPDSRQVMIFAMSRLALNVGTTAAPLIGAALLSVSYAALFWGQAGTAAAYAVIALSALPHHGASRALKRTTAATPGRGGYLTVASDRRYVLFLIAVLINAAVYVQYLSTLPLAMRHAGLGVFWYGAMVALNGFVVITCELLMTKVTQRRPARVIVALGFGLTGGGMAIYALPGRPAVFVIGTLIWSLAEIIEGPTTFAYPAQASSKEMRGRYIGMAHGMYGIGSALGPITGVALWTWLGSRVWLICAALALAGLAPAWYGIRSTGAAKVLSEGVAP